jgi:2-polyprenyl-3-methyl-5-hydroxy-6-metoxy-1,4-benzoquinol methylase
MRDKQPQNCLELLSEDFRYNRANALVENIHRYVRASAGSSLLDIGAGGPSMAIPLSRIVKRYLAIEEDQEVARVLQAEGLDTLVGTFPVQVHESFDLVLSCHTVPEAGVEYYSEFLDCAWHSVKVGGVLLVVTFKGGRGDSAILREELTGSAIGKDPQFEAILQNLARLGVLRIEKINTYVRSPRITDIIGYIGKIVFRAESEKLTHLDRLAEILFMRYRLDDVYIFPLQHLFLSVTRTKM